MNAENMDKLIVQMEAMPDKAFDLSHWIEGPLKVYENGLPSSFIKNHPVKAKAVLKKQRTTGDCGTVACIAGEATILAVAEGNVLDRDVSVRETARDWLKLTNKQATTLFTPNVARKAVTKAQAVAVLKEFRLTKRISMASWTRAGVAKWPV